MKPDELVSDISMCLVAHQPEFEDPQILVSCLSNGLSAAGVEVDGMIRIRGDDYHLAPLPAAGIYGAIESKLNRAAPKQLSLREGCLAFTRTPERYLGDYWSENFELRLWLVEGTSWARAENIFCTLIDTLGCFWGEMISKSVVGEPTLSGPNEHESQVPNLGNVNYFGPEYIRHFGGPERFFSASGWNVVRFGPGLLTRLDTAPAHEEYLSVRSAIRAHLGERLFDPQAGVDRSLYLSLFGPSDRSRDPHYEFIIEPRDGAVDADSQ